MGDDNAIEGDEQRAFLDLSLLFGTFIVHAEAVVVLVNIRYYQSLYLVATEAWRLIWL